jgi:hypothetical protein
LAVDVPVAEDPRRVGLEKRVAIMKICNASQRLLGSIGSNEKLSDECLVEDVIQSHTVQIDDMVEPLLDQTG